MKKILEALRKRKAALLCALGVVAIAYPTADSAVETATAVIEALAGYGAPTEEVK